MNTIITAVNLLTVLCILAAAVILLIAMKRMTEQKSLKKQDETSIPTSDIKLQDLPDARQSWYESKVPQLKNVIRSILGAKSAGLTHAYIADSEKLHNETIDVLLAKGYDVHIGYYEHSQAWTNTVVFNDTASGRLTFESAEAKKKQAYPNDVKNGTNVIKKSPY